MTTPRIIELRRRVERDPASIAFAQLAEEYRREGDHEQAVQVCRAGLAQYPEYLSARVTLGRALTELGRFDQARAELEQVLTLAPDNLAANRAIDDLRHRMARAAAAAPDTTADAPGTYSAVDAQAQESGIRPAASRDRELLARLEALLAAVLADRADRQSTSARRDAPA